MCDLIETEVCGNCHWYETWKKHCRLKDKETMPEKNCEGFKCFRCAKEEE